MRALRKSNSGLSPSFEATKAFRGLDVRPSTSGRVQEENLHCGFVRDRRLALVCVLLGNYPASVVYMPTFRNTLSVPSS